MELFGWPYADIEKECTFLSKAGWMGVKVYPPQEHLLTDYWLADNGELNPWYYNYQPVSYKLDSRSGKKQF